MKLSKLFLTLLLAGTLSMIGCGDDGGGSGSGGSNGNGTSAGEACDGPDCANDPEEKAVCEAAFNACIDTGINVEECVIGAELICG